MAKIKTSSKSKTSIFLCCFGSNNDSSSVKEANYISKEKSSSWFSWRKIRIKMKSTSKTVPLEASFSHVKAYSKSRSKLSSTTLHKKSKTTPTNPPPLPQAPSPPHPATPYYSPTQTRHGPINTNNNITEEQIIRTTPTRPKRQERRLSSAAIQNHTTNKNARNSYDPIIGMSVLVVTLVIMIFWGRFCAILCTSAWLYFIPRFRDSVVVVDDDDHHDDAKMKSKNVVDLDSEEYKKKVIMEGLLGRNNRGNNNK